MLHLISGPRDLSMAPTTGQAPMTIGTPLSTMALRDATQMVKRLYKAAIFGRLSTGSVDRS